MGSRFDHLDSASMLVLADIVASAPIAGEPSGGNQHGAHRERVSRRPASMDHSVASKYAGSGAGEGTVGSGYGSGNFFLPEGVGQGARRGGGGGSTSSESSSMDSNSNAAPRKEHLHVSREWRSVAESGRSRGASTGSEPQRALQVCLSGRLLPLSQFGTMVGLET